jgi:hypothetical protein
MKTIEPHKHNDEYILHFKVHVSGPRWTNLISSRTEEFQEGTQIFQISFGFKWINQITDKDRLDSKIL